MLRLCNSYCVPEKSHPSKPYGILSDVNILSYFAAFRKNPEKYFEGPESDVKTAEESLAGFLLSILLWANARHQPARQTI